MWPTPTSSLGTHAGLVTSSKAREGGTLVEAIAARTEWPTPTARAWKDNGESPAELARNSPTSRSCSMRARRSSSRSASVRAADDSLLLELDPETFQKQVLANPAAKKALDDLRAGTFIRHA